jgi:hypothetical protein
VNWWMAETMWSIWIVGGRYITCVSVRRSFDEVLEAVIEKVQELGPFLEGQPVILVTSYSLSNGNLDTLRNVNEDAVTIILE